MDDVAQRLKNQGKFEACAECVRDKLISREVSC